MEPTYGCFSPEASRSETPLKPKCFIPIMFSLFAITTLLYLIYKPYPKSECYICSGRFQSLISCDAAFGLIDLNTRNPSTIPKGDWSNGCSTTINSSGNGIVIMLSPDITDRYRADIYLSEDSRPQKKIMSKYLCQDCIDEYSTMEYSIILMDATSGSIYPLTKNMYLELTPYKISANTQEDSLIRLYFEKTE